MRSKSGPSLPLLKAGSLLSRSSMLPLRPSLPGMTSSSYMLIEWQYFSAFMIGLMWMSAIWVFKVQGCLVWDWLRTYIWALALPPPSLVLSCHYCTPLKSCSTIVFIKFLEGSCRISLCDGPWLIGAIFLSSLLLRRSSSFFFLSSAIK